MGKTYVTKLGDLIKEELGGGLKATHRRPDSVAQILKSAKCSENNGSRPRRREERGEERVRVLR